MIIKPPPLLAKDRTLKVEELLLLVKAHMPKELGPQLGLALRLMPKDGGLLRAAPNLMLKVMVR